jgi:purine nucleosidase
MKREDREGPPPTWSIIGTTDADVTSQASLKIEWMAMSAVLRLLIDTDTAGDDTIALLMAMKSRNVRLEGITINCGNVSFDQEVENALYTVEVAGLSGKVPVYPGARHPLLKDWNTVEEVHGKDGMGDSFFPRATQRPETKFAADAIIETINGSPGEITMVEIAPMTNMALALRKDPSIARKVRHFYFMGGTNQYIGNITPAAEFNMWVDPDAAKIVLHAGMPMTMVGWEICMRHGLIGEKEYAVIGEYRTKEAEFFVKVNRVARQFTKKVNGIDASTCPDSMTVSIVTEPSVATSVFPRFVDVDNTSGISRGATIVDHYGITGLPPNANVVYEASESKFKEMLFGMLRAEPN